mgnify:CR=1 FL=1
MASLAAGLLSPPRSQMSAQIADASFHARAIASASRIVVSDPALLVKSIAATRRARSHPPPEVAAGMPRTDSSPVLFCLASERSAFEFLVRIGCPETGWSSAADAGVDRTITFTGCGGLYVYLFGVAAYIQQKFEWDPATTAFASASAGAYPAFLLNAGIDIESFHHNENRAFLAAVDAPPRDGRVSALGCWNEVLAREWRASVIGRLTSEEISQLLQHRHFISLTRLPTLENVLISSFDSIDDLVDGFIASGYLPLYDRDGKLGASWRGERFFDGGLSDNAPRPFGDEVPALVLGPSTWRNHTDLPGAIPFVNADWEWCDAKFELGKADAREHHEELARFFVDADER